MFKSIRSRFIAIYFILVLVAMMIVGLFIVNRLENTQLASMEEDMKRTASTMLSSSEKFSTVNWSEEQFEIQRILDEWKVNSNYQIYAIYGEEAPEIVASVNVNAAVVGRSALSYKGLSPEMILISFGGDIEERTISSQGDILSEMHITYPILDYEGEINGIFYMIGNLDSLNTLLMDSQRILLNAGLLALLVAIALGLLLSSSITGPIMDLTRKVKVVAQGDYSQKVDVKSDDEIGQLSSMFNFFTDELQETISNMEIERAKLNTIFDYMAEGVLALNSQNDLIHANQVAKEILHLPKGDISNNKINLGKLNIFDIDYKDKSTLEGVAFATIDDRHYNLIYGPYLDDLGIASGLIIVFQDISKEHRLDEMRKDFVANVSHELKTPLTTIKTYTETLLENEMDRDTNQRFLGIINKETNRMTRLVQDLLELSNIDNKSSLKNLESIHLVGFINNCIRSLEVMREEKNIKLSFKNINKDLEIVNHRDSLEKIIINILSNAYKYSDENGRVVIEVMDFKDSFSLSIKDEGMGIPYADQRHVFERFYRVEKGRSRKAGGTGLGLSIAKELVEKLKGTILIKSRPNYGTEVVLTFPKIVEETP